jgi:hypothetical protein
MGNTCCYSSHSAKPLLQEAHQISIGAVPPGKDDVSHILKNRWTGTLIQQHPTLPNLYLFQIYRGNVSWLVYVSLEDVSLTFQDRLFAVLKKDTSCIIDFKKVQKAPDQYSGIIYRSNYLYEINDISVNEELRILFNDLGETV